MNRVSPGATAFAHRDADFQIVCIGAWDDASLDADGIAWTRATHEATSDGSLNGGFLNFNSYDYGRDSRPRVRAGYGANWERLVEIKQRYDPGNLFRENNNIAP
jgi:FAD/FMN-containing dehydrogenase